MTVIGNLLGNNGVDVGIKTNSGARDDSFSRMMSEIDRRDRAQSTQRTTVDSGRQRTAVSSNGNQNAQGRPVDENRATNPETRLAESTNTDANTSFTANEGSERPALSEEVVEELVEDVACALQITPPELLAVLVNLEIVPEDLVEAKNITLVISEVLEAENPAQLLGMEGVKEMFTEINEAVLTAYEKPAAEPVQMQAEAAQASTEEVSAFIPVQNAEDMVNLQTAMGEEIALEESSDETAQSKVEVSGVQNNQTGNEAGNGENANGDGEQNELFGNAEIDYNMAVQPTVENRATANFTPINTETPQAAANREIANQILDKIKIDVRPGVSEIKMNLRPESLGEVSLRIASENGIITAHFVAESQRVKEIIESNFNQLRDSLEEQGVNISELSVSVSTGNSEQHMSEFLKERSKSQARIANILASLENVEPEEVNEQDVYNNTLNIKI